VQLVKFVSDELLELMGKEAVPLNEAKSGPTVILMAGLQGVGKTTACGKLALFLKKQGKSVMMIGTDIYRPAAIDQLKTLGEQVRPHMSSDDTADFEHAPQSEVVHLGGQCMTTSRV